MGLSAALSIVAPPLCFGCGAHAGGDRALCAACRRALRWLGVPAEDDGGLDTGGAAGAEGGGPGGPASAAGGGLFVWAPLAYEGPAAALVRALKFRGARGLADVMAGPIAAGAPPWLFGREAGSGAAEAARLVPVPLHPARRRRRGFNQAALLASALATRTGLEVDDCLERRGGAGTQMGRDRPERAAAMAQAVRVRGRAPPLAVLVDDVVTTGATLGACAAALRREGAVDVRAVTYARTPGR